MFEPLREKLAIRFHRHFWSPNPDGDCYGSQIALRNTSSKLSNKKSTQ